MKKEKNMSKTKKIATAAVSLVLAASMCIAFAACSDDSVVDPGDSAFVYGSIDLGRPSSASDAISSLSNYGLSTFETTANNAFQSALTYYNNRNTVNTTTSQPVLDPSLDSNDKLTWDDDLSLNMNMGQSSSVSLAFSTDNISGSYTATLLDGKSYTANSLKPAWRSLSEKLGVTLVDSFNDEGSNSNRINNLIQAERIDEYAMVTGTAEQIVSAGTSSQTFLDLSLYLDYMPNFKAFLEANPATYMSLVSNTSTGAIYYAPYYDGNDDIEKYELMNKHWVIDLLDSTSAGDSTTYATQASSKSNAELGLVDGTQASVESFMGTTGKWTIASTDPTDETKTVNVTVNYDAVLTAANDSTTDLGQALTAAGVTVGSLTSGNIVDLQNEAINATEGEVTGAQLLAILRAYIDVAYQDADGDKYYATRSDVFNGDDAAWDVDLLVGYMRCLVTNTGLLRDSSLSSSSYNIVYGLMGRQGTMQRQTDLVSLAGELYGVRGLTSRYQYSYVDEDGVLQDARADEESYDAMDKMNAMAKEGLIYTGVSQSANNTSFYTSATTPIAGMIYDYVQTQTSNGGFVEQGVTSNDEIPDGYDFSPIVTPVSKWDDGTTNDTGYTYLSGEKVMRFTESWRSVKNTGFAIPYAYVQNNPDALSACLAIIDYMFSNDGQILMTYGEVSSNDNISGDTTSGFSATTDGWWYADEISLSSITVNGSVVATSLSDIATVVESKTACIDDQYTIKSEYASQYFIYDGKVYGDDDNASNGEGGVYYKGEMQPRMTTASLQLFYGYEVNGLQVGATASQANPIGGISVNRSYTNYARNIIGSAQPMGNKLQSFEYQCTAECGIEGANVVAAGIVNGTISHVSLTPDSSNMWYFIVPTTLPYSTAQTSTVDTQCYDLNNTIFTISSSATINFYWEIICYGYAS